MPERLRVAIYWVLAIGWLLAAIIAGHTWVWLLAVAWCAVASLDTWRAWSSARDRS